ncbi:MAG: DNA polymerase/3'-5' exonuclease PolX [Halanaerobium sp.]|nr:DNA polymerase/3'-5' exonuclease PolX [Halanaerobium sp.]
MKNFTVARIFNEIADLLEIRGDNYFKVRAYRKGAERVATLPEKIEDVVTEGKLANLDGIGKGLAGKIEEIVSTGDCSFHEELVDELPPGLIEVLKVPGVGPKMAQLFFTELDVTSVDKLLQAARDRKIRKLPGMGAKKEFNIIDAIERQQNWKGRYLLSQGYRVAGEILYYLRNLPQVVKAEFAGSLRRSKETIGDLDLLVAAREREENIMDLFVNLPLVREVVNHGETKSSIITMSGIQVDLRVVSPEEYPAALVYFTGSRAHNVHLRQLAREAGWKLNEYGLFAEDSPLPVKGESDLYSHLGLEYIPPEIREDRGEIDAASRGALPRLLEIGDMKGDLHLHTTWSDGGNTIEEMAREAGEMGYEYMAICDHSRSLKIAGGLTVAQLREQMEAIDLLNSKGGLIPILKGVEVDILRDGKLDHDDKLLAEMDIVVASIHSGFRQTEEEITTRVLRAIENPNVDIIAHPTGRMLEKREPYAIDVEKIIKAARENDTALELNASPERLDLNDRYLMMARDAGVKVSINSDAHNCEQLHFRKYGIGTARRAWLECDDVINTYTLEKLLDFVAK